MGFFKNLSSLFKSDESHLDDLGIRGAMVFYPLNRYTARQSELYIHEYPPSTRNLCLSLNGMLKWVYSNSEYVIRFQYYTIIPLNEFNLYIENGDPLKRKYYDTIAVTIPFTIKVLQVYNMPELDMFEDVDMFK